MASNFLLAQPGATNPADAFNAGYDRGQQKQVNRLLGQAIADPDNSAAPIGQAAAIDPRSALDVQGSVQNDKDARQKKLAGAANYVLSAYKTGNPQQVEGAYQAVRPFLNQLGQELGQGEASPNFTPDMLPHLYQIVGQAGGDTAINGALPGGVREFNAMSQNLSPEDRLKAQRINLGLDARAVTGAAKTGMITGSDGRERPYVFDPSTGSYKVFDGSQFRGLDQSEAAQMGGGSANAGVSLTPEQLMAQATTMANQGGPGANAPAAQAWLQQQLATQGRLPTPASGQGALGVGRAPEDTAGAVQNAKNASDLAYAPAQENVKVDAAIRQAGGTAAATNAAKNQAEQSQAFQQRQADARKTLSDLDEVDRLLPQATGGTVGKTVDSAAAAFNHSTDTAKASAQLDILAGRLTSAVPRMQGPQSDRDVELYQKQAGDLANRSLPIGTRQSAANELRRLQLKYLDNPYGNGSVQPSGQNQAAPAAHAPVDDLLSKYGVH